MAASSSGEFEDWLSGQLKALNTDQEIFGNYIKGILEGDETDDEKIEALEGILSEVSDNAIVPLCKEILLKWTDGHSTACDKNAAEVFDVNEKIATIIEQQSHNLRPEKTVTDEEKQYREAIVAQYSQVSDDEGSSDEHPGTERTASSTSATSQGDSFLVRNVNADSVLKAEKDRRDKAKLETEKKKAQDKVNREKQKQQQQERKEREKKRTQKGERRR